MKMRKKAGYIGLCIYGKPENWDIMVLFWYAEEVPFVKDIDDIR